MRSFRFAKAIAVALVLAAGSLKVAAEGAPLIEDTDFTNTNDPVASCGDFQIIQDGAGTIRLWTYFDRNGVPYKIAFHGLYKGTLTNSVTGKFVTDAPSAVRITADLRTGVETRIGAFFTVTLPHVGNVMFEVGRLVFDGNGPPVFIAGQQRPPDESVALLCDALR